MSNNWRPPHELPDLRRAGTIALDTETRDGGLLADRGAAWPWGDGHICGVSIAWRAESAIRAIYVPLRHPDSANFDRDQVTRWLHDLIAPTRTVGVGVKHRLHNRSSPSRTL